MAAIAMQVLPNLWGGLKCFARIDTLPTDQCGMSPVYVGLYLLFNITYSTLLILILKFGSANILWLAMTIMVPMGDLAFALPFMPSAQPVLPTDGLGLAVIMLGICLYRFNSLRLPAAVRQVCPACFGAAGDEPTAGNDSSFSAAHSPDEQTAVRKLLVVGPSGGSIDWIQPIADALVHQRKVRSALQRACAIPCTMRLLVDAAIEGKTPRKCVTAYKILRSVFVCYSCGAGVISLRQCTELSRLYV